MGGATEGPVFISPLIPQIGQRGPERKGPALHRTAEPGGQVHRASHPNTHTPQYQLLVSRAAWTPGAPGLPWPLFADMGNQSALSQESSLPSFRLSCQAPRPIPRHHGGLWATPGTAPAHPRQLL